MSPTWQTRRAGARERINAVLARTDDLLVEIDDLLAVTSPGSAPAPRLPFDVEAESYDNGGRGAA